MAKGRPSLKAGLEALVEALRNPGSLLDCSPYPVAFVGFDGRVHHATPDFPIPGSGISLKGALIWDSLPAAEVERIRAFFEGCAEGLYPAALPSRPQDRIAEPASCDVPDWPVAGTTSVLYAMRGPAGALGLIAVAVPPDSRVVKAALLEARESRHRQRLAAVFEASREISSSLERNVILQNIIDRVCEVVGVREATLFLMQEDGQTLAPVVARVDEFYDEVMQLRLKTGEGIVGTVAKSGRAEIVNHAENDPRSIQVPGTPVEPTSLLCAPLTIKGRVAGVLALSRFGDEGFEPDDLEVTTILAAHCSVAIENGRLYEDLRQTVEELRSTQNQLVQSAKLNALGEMAGGVAHDFNNILTAILGRTQLLLRRIRDKDVRRALEVIEQSAMDGAHTVRRIQEFTRVRHDESRESVDLNEVLLQVVDLTRTAWQAQAKARGIRIDVETALHAEQLISGSGAEMREVFTNLLLNAIDALPQGGRIRLETEDKGDRILVRVIDTGIGMDEDTRLRVFDPFFTTKREKGTGLGLSVAYGILSRHHADIRVESAPGRGAAFHLNFPAATAVPEEDVAVEAAPDTGSLRVVCVDDEAPVLDVLGDLLEILGHTVERAIGGRAGVERARAQHPDIVFTDLGMPDLNGWQVASAVKESHSDTLVVLVTGWGVQLEAGPSRQRGVDFILPKPFTMDDVRQVVADAIELRRERPAA